MGKVLDQDVPVLLEVHADSDATAWIVLRFGVTPTVVKLGAIVIGIRELIAMSRGQAAGSLVEIREQAGLIESNVQTGDALALPVQAQTFRSKRKQSGHHSKSKS